MSVTATVRVMSAEEIAAQGGGQPPFLNWPERTTTFAERGMRLTQRAAGGHPMADYLQFIASVANEQQQELAAFPPVPLPDPAALDAAALAGTSPLSVEQWPRDAAWRTGLVMLATNLRDRVPATVRPAIERVLAMPADDLERQAGRLLTGVMQGVDMATAPLIAAALQVYWTHLLLAVRAAQTGEAEPFGRIADERLCPCCGSRPTVSIIRNAGQIQGQRYLHCSLCGLEWHQTRIRCTHCLSGKSIAFQALDAAGADDAGTDEAADATATPGPGFKTISSPEAANRAARAAIQAETCDECGHYLKLLHADRDPLVEPIADDLASLPLDLLVSEAGMIRHGVNLMLLIGAADDDHEAPPGERPRPPDPGGH